MRKSNGNALMLTSALLTGGVIALTAGGAIALEKTGGDTTKSIPSVIAAPHPAKTAGDVADRLDAVLQPRFLEQAEDFGMDRIYIPLNAHQYTTRGENGVRIRQPLYELIGRAAEEKLLLTEANAPERDYVVGFLHCANTLGKPTDPRPLGKPTDPQPLSPMVRFEPLVIHENGISSDNLRDHNKLAAWERKNLTEISKALTDSAAKAQKGKKIQAQAGMWLLTLRPVLAQKSCLACHGRAKTGDTLGVMAYAVKK